ncbi:MAG TPA: ABC transporter ATP-binding protein [Chloroflexota bacterium]|nr:ABC transporter ATP-binding protein [Chloroflexota bacterium]
MKGIEAREISRTFRVDGHALPVLCGVSVAAPPGGFVAVLGPSGSGKSTLLSIMAGLDRPDAGRVVVDGRDVTGRLGLAGYMPQRDLLLPWRRTLDNVALGPELSGMSRADARRLAASHFPRFGLAGFERAYPRTLSGGMRQRAALLRTFLSEREILLLDEPLGALDAMTRMDLQSWLLDVWEEMRKTIVLVTHDVDEAIYLADRIYLLSSRPARVSAVLDVDLRRPRPYDEIVTSTRFLSLKREILGLLGHRPVVTT